MNFPEESRLSEAMKNDDVDKVKSLISNPEYQSIPFFSTNEQKLMNMAALYKRSDTVRLFLSMGYDPNGPDLFGEIPLHFACKSIGDNSEIINMLLEAGSNVNHANRFGFTALHYATHNQNTVKILVRNGADINASAKSELETPLHCAISRSNAEVVKLLIDAGAKIPIDDDFNNQPRFGKNLLHTACNFMERGTDVLELLLANGAPIDVVDEFDYDPLCCCVRLGCKNLDRLSLHRNEGVTPEQYGINVEKRVNGRLGYWSNPKEVDIVLRFMESFVRHGAKLKQDNTSRCITDPLTVALTNNGHWQIVHFFYKRGATLDFDNELIRKVIERPDRYFELSYYLLSRGLKKLRTTNKNFNTLRLNESQKKFCADCAEELIRMNGTRVPRTTTTIRDILVDDNVGKCAKNFNVPEFVDGEVVLKEFPIYGHELIERFRQIKNSRILITDVRLGLERIFGWDRYAYSVIFDRVIDHLDEQSLKAVTFI